MNKVVLKLDLHDEKGMKKAMKRASDILGVDSIEIDSNKLTLTGDMDPVEVVDRLKKICYAEVVTVGPAKKPETKKEDDKKKKDSEKDGAAKCTCSQRQVCHCHPCPTPAFYVVEEDPCPSSWGFFW